MSAAPFARATGPLLAAATASYCASAAFGAAVAAGVVDNARIRWVHHALFTATASLTGTALAAGVLGRRTPVLVLLPACVAFAVLPRIRRHRAAGRWLSRHVGVAAAAAPWFGAALVLVFRRR